MLGLALMAVGVFLGFVLYGSGGAGVAGGRGGHALAVALGWTLGGARVLAPVAVLAAGMSLLLRPVLPALRPLRAGALCLFASVTLALAAGTLGLSSGPAEGSSWTSAHLQSHGGVAGQGLWALAHPLVQDAGVQILVVFLLLAGVILVTGASLAGVLRATGHGLVDTTRMVRAGKQRPAGKPSRAAATARDEGEEPLGPPEPADHQLIVRATHVEAPSRDWLDEGEAAETDVDAAEPDEGASPAPAGRTPAGDGVGGVGQAGVEEDPDPAEELPGVARADPAELTPQGRLRGVVTDDPDFVWQLPDAARLLSRSTGEQSRPDTAGQERIATSLVEALGHFGVEAKVIGTVAGPHITRYELRLAPGHEGRQGGPAQGRPRLRARRHRHPHPRADPRQAGGWRRGAERAPPHRQARRRLPGAPEGLVAADGVARQGRRGQGDRRRPREDAAPARRGHDRRRASPARSTRCSQAFCCAPRRTRCGSCSWIPSRWSSTTTSRSRTC